MKYLEFGYIILLLFSIFIIFCVGDIVRFSIGYHKMGYTWKESVKISIKSLFDTHNDDKLI